MKYIAFILSLFLNLTVFCQSDVQRSASNTMVDNYGKFKYWLGFPRFPDTSTANLTTPINYRGQDTAGRIISTYDNKLWIRNANPKKWIEITTASSSLAYIKAQVTIDYVSIAAGGNNQNDVTVNGTSVGDLVLVDQDPGQSSIVYSGWCIGGNQIRIRAYNTTGAPIDPGVHTFNVIVFKY